MKKTLAAAALIALFMTAAFAVPVQHAFAQEQEGDEEGVQIDWQFGPATVSLGDVAELELREGYLFAGPEDTRTLMTAMQNIPTGRELGFLIKEDDDWFVLFEFNDIGYVNDEEKDSLDAEAILKSIREGNEEANKLRREKGWPTVDVTGWYISPRYNPSTNNLEWAVKGQGEEGPVVNLNTRILGRGGVMEATLVSDPSRMDELMPTYEEVITDFSYKQGHKYSEYIKGDKLAKVGLTALIVGGATAAAAKSGLLKGLWKFIVAGAVAVGAFFKKFFSKNKA